MRYAYHGYYVVYVDGISGGNETSGACQCDGKIIQ